MLEGESDILSGSYHHKHDIDISFKTSVNVQLYKYLFIIKNTSPGVIYSGVSTHPTFFLFEALKACMSLNVIIFLIHQKLSMNWNRQKKNIASW